jgi:hypothetical protein
MMVDLMWKTLQMVFLVVMMEKRKAVLTGIFALISETAIPSPHFEP